MTIWANNNRFQRTVSNVLLTSEILARNLRQFFARYCKNLQRFELSAVRPQGGLRDRVLVAVDEELTVVDPVEDLGARGGL